MNDFLVRIEVSVPSADTHRVAALREREAQVGWDLMQRGVLVRMWRVPGRQASVSLWSVPDATALDAALRELPMFPWMDVVVEPLARHYLEAERS
jgi:muconolactone D-isomerase